MRPKDVLTRDGATSSALRERTERSERGDTLVEVLLSLIVLGLTAISLLLAFSTSISASSTYRDLAVDDTALRSLSESVISQFQGPLGLPLQPCSTATAVTYNRNLNLLLPTAPPRTSPYDSTYKATITSVGFWNGSGFPTTSVSCVNGYPQQLTVQVLKNGVNAEKLDVVIAGKSQIIGLALTPGTQTISATVSSSSTSYSSSVTVSSTGSSGTGAISYLLDTGGTGSTSSGVCKLSGTSLTATGPGTCYVYVTIAADSNYGAATSSDQTVVFTATNKLSAPTNVSVAAGSAHGSVVITFTNSASATSYKCFIYSDVNLQTQITSQSCASGSQIGGAGHKLKAYVTVTASASGYVTSDSSSPTASGNAG
jgi:hypothetical protein